MWKTLVIPIILQIASCSLSLSTASAQDFNALECTCGSGQQFYLSLHPSAANSLDGIVVGCEHSADRGWIVITGTFRLSKDANVESNLSLRWSDGSTLATLVNGDSMTVKNCSNSPDLVGQSIRIRVASPPPAVSAAMLASARRAAGVSNPPIGSDAWVVQQRANQDFMRTIRDASLGWYE